MINSIILPPFYHTPETVAQMGSILTHKDGYQWVMDHYVTTYFQKTTTHSIIEGFLDASKMWDCPFIKYSEVFRSDLLTLHIDLIEFLKGLVENGFYIFLLINYYHVKDSSIYHKINAGHSVLLSGYDAEKKAFLLSDFSGDTDNRYGFSTISEEELLAAMIHCDPQEFEKNDSLYANQFQKDYFECIRFFKVNHEISYKFNKAVLLEQLQLYVEEKPPTQITYFPCGFFTEDAVWGIGMSNSFLEYLNRAALSQYSWKEIQRFVYFLGVIRQLMDLRIDFLKEFEGLEKWDLLKEQNRTLWNMQEILLKIVIKNAMRRYRIDKNNVGGFKELIYKYFKEEVEFLDKFIELV